MTERSFFNFGSQPGDFDRLDSTPWVHRFGNLNRSIKSIEDNIVEATFDEETLPTHAEIIELIESLHSGEVSPFTHRPTTARPRAIQLPDHYEPRYAYPLIVWFHSDESSEAELASIIPRISDRNYLGLALRGNVTSKSGYSWSTSDGQFEKLVNDVEALVRDMRRQYHVHSERIYLAGYGSGAKAALDVFLQKPEWFGAVASLCGSCADLKVPASEFGELQSKRVLLATTAGNRLSGVRDLVAAGQMLYSSGMQIGTRVYQEPVTGPSPKMLSDLNNWLMDDVCSVSQ